MLTKNEYSIMIGLIKTQINKHKSYIRFYKLRDDEMGKRKLESKKKIESQLNKHVELMNKLIELQKETI